MKRFFTIKLKATVFLFFVVLNSVSVSADEYKSMIRYDRIWECVSYENGTDVIKCMRFDGTEEIDGKTYHRIVTCKKTIANYINDSFEFETVNDIWEHEGYLREEDGAVYTLVVAYKDEESPTGYGYLYIPSSSNTDLNEIEISEQKIYDFNCSDGDKYDGFSFVMKNGEPCNFTVKSMANVDIAGEECKEYNVVASEFFSQYPDAGVPVIEGIGAVENGCLNYHEFITGVDMIWYHKELSRILDLEGNVIFNSGVFDQYDLKYGSFASANDITLEHDASEAMYDIMGRRISSAAPGQLYIQGGKKRIAPKY